ncbi:MAG: family 43 glycosylhydrolase, partial [Planctomycetaceae bacterium]|nr:family 43 glycosylhydrolase [Planctomycetaceae bacterium]
NRSLYELADIDPPENVSLDGENLLSTLLGKEKASRSAPIFWRRPPDRPGTKDEDNPDLAVRDGRWKYLVNYDGSDPQLYDLNQDPTESTNLTKQHPEVVSRLHEKVIDWNADLPQDAGNPDWKDETETGSLPSDMFVNPIAEGADPWVVRDPNANRYLWCLSEGNRAIAIHPSDSLTALGPKQIVWTAPASGPYSREVWAPELHFLDDRWHIYFAASDGRNENHLTYVLRSKSPDPLGDYELFGPLATGEGPERNSPNIWAIDMTVLEHSGKRYAVWSGWDAPGTDRQYLYIAEMESPTKLAGPRVRLCDNADFLWERVEPNQQARGLNEGPEVFQTEKATSIVYSCGGSWLPTYKLGLLELNGNNPLDPGAWKKRDRPLFEGTNETYGAGHSCFVKSPDGKQWWHIFHAKRDRNPGWRRAIFVQPMDVGRRGYPVFGTPIKAGTPLDVPSGQRTTRVSTDTNRFTYFGHHQFYSENGKTIHLGKTPDHPINEYRSGEKIVLNHPVPQDFEASVTIDFLGDTQARDAGILFRCSGASVGYDSQRGYFAGLIPRTRLVILGKTDGTSWQELARAKTEIVASEKQHLTVRMTEGQITVFHNDSLKISHHDETYPQGTVGLRVVNTEAAFEDFKVVAKSP